MRRLAAVTVVAAIAFVAAGCGSDTASDPTASTPTAAATSASPTPDGAADTKQVCAEVKQLNSESASKITAAITTAVQAAAKNDQAAGEKAVAEANATTKSWVSGLEAASTKAGDPELAKALNDLATEVKKLESEDATLDQLKTTVKNGETALAKYCG
jgi:exonuclease VII large subunit